MTLATQCRITEEVSQWLTKLAQERALGEPVRWDVSFTVMPTQERGGFMPCLLIYLAIPGLVIGEWSHATTILTNLNITEDVIEEHFDQVMESLRTQRSEQASQALTIPANGHKQGWEGKPYGANDLRA